MNKEKTTENSSSDQITKDYTKFWKVPVFVKDKEDFLKYYEKQDNMFSDNILKERVFWREQKIDGILTGKVEIKPLVPWGNKDIIKEINKIKD